MSTPARPPRARRAADHLPAELPPDIADKYSAIIDSILEDADLNTISAKRIRKGLQERLGHDISGEKVHIYACPGHPRADLST